MACGIPLISAPWDDTEGLFTPGRDFLVARNGAEMRRHLRDVLHDTQLSESLVLHAFRTIHERHTCSHRVNELFAFMRELGSAPATLARTIAV
jgi:spore maturation protein CgeB